jgi:hypothetical protein
MRIRYASRADDGSRRITTIGGLTPTGVPWTLPTHEAASGALEGRWAFFVRDRDGRRQMVIPARREDGSLSLEGAEDGTAALLALPACPQLRDSA